jgi:fatty-acyl-CoA synthase
MTLGGLIREVSAREPDHEAIVTAEERLSYRGLHDRSVGVARVLASNGVEKGSKVAILLPNGPDWVSVFFGATMIGAIVVTINTFAPDDDIEYMLTESDTEVLVTDRSTMEDLGDGALVGRHPILDPDADAPQDGGMPAFRTTLLIERGDISDDAGAAGDDVVDAMVADVGPDDDALVMFTSGSTGRAKPVLHAHKAICIQSWRWAALEQHEPSDRVYTTAPFFWSSGLVRSMGGPLAAGATLVLQARFDPLEALRLLEKERVTTMLSRPHLDLRMLEAATFDEHDLSTIRKLYEQSPLRQRLLGEQAAARVGAYGMTETMTILSYRRAATDEEDPAHGDVLPGITVRIVDPDTGATTPLGVPGQISVRGATVMRGYYRRDRDEAFDDEGYFRTSDAGFLDHDGRLHWTGRLDNVIKVAGVNVSPTDVERQLAGWESLVAYSVFAVPHPTLGAALVLSASVRQGSAGVDETAIREFLEGRLASYQMPRHIVIVDPDEVPFTATLKVDVKGLQSLAFQRLLHRLDDDWLTHVRELQASGRLPSFE